MTTLPFVSVRKHPSGCGNKGGLYHHWLLFDKFHPSYFGKVSMSYFDGTNVMVGHNVLRTPLT